MPSRHRRLLVVPLVLFALFAYAAPVSAASVRDTWPVQNIHDRGSNVSAIQGLLRAHGSTIEVSGTYDAGTKTAVIAFQTAHGLTANGIVAASTWDALVVPLKQGDSGEAVKALQRLLIAKRHASLSVTGVFGSVTRDRVAAFQAHYGMTIWGSVGPVTWRRLVAHFQYPSFGTNLCAYTVGNGNAHWATGSAIGLLKAAETAFLKLGYGRISMGDASFEHGGDIPGHETHEQGLDMDLRLIRTDEKQCTWGTNRFWSTYDRAATRALIKTIRATAPGHVKLIYFNDPVLIHEGLTTWFKGHDDHLHVRYCESSHPLAMYDC
jgi:peptidoglycan hydrolase-like protein with peptidoglycan-binding domain